MNVCKAQKYPKKKKNLLDRALTIQEFDTAIQKANKKSAPGTDGLNNVFISKFWEYFRITVT
jgi:hypothetical protein